MAGSRWLTAAVELGAGGAGRAGIAAGLVATLAGGLLTEGVPNKAFTELAGDQLIIPSFQIWSSGESPPFAANRRRSPSVTGPDFWPFRL